MLFRKIYLQSSLGIFSFLAFLDFFLVNTVTVTFFPLHFLFLPFKKAFYLGIRSSTSWIFWLPNKSFQMMSGFFSLLLKILLAYMSFLLLNYPQPVEQC